MPRPYRTRKATSNSVLSETSPDPDFFDSPAVGPEPFELSNPTETPPEQETIEGERLFDTDLVLTLKPAGQKAVKIPLLTGKFRGTLIEAFINQAISDKRNQKILSAVLDNPKTGISH